MARGNVTVTKSRQRGTALAAEVNGDPVNHHQFVNNGNTRLLVRNASVDTAYDVTIRIARKVSGQAVQPIVVEVPFGATWTFGPYDVRDFGDLVLVDVENANLKLRCLG